MMKEKYERTELEVIRFLNGDVIMTSEPVDDEPEDDYMMPIR